MFCNARPYKRDGEHRYRLATHAGIAALFTAAPHIPAHACFCRTSHALEVKACGVILVRHSATLTMYRGATAHNIGGDINIGGISVKRLENGNRSGEKPGASYRYGQRGRRRRVATAVQKTLKKRRKKTTYDAGNACGRR